MERYETPVSGGCQCGAVRYHATAMLDNAHVCHCRMCQKAVGNLFAALVAAPRDALVWTRGNPAIFMSSEHAARGFCRDCGTPLFYDYLGGDRVNLTMGSLDEPDRFPPAVQMGIESRRAIFPALSGLPEQGTTETSMPDEAAAILHSNRQHPDHDTPDPASAELGPRDVTNLVALWQACGLTRPWNDPVRDAVTALGGATSTILGQRDASGVLVASAMVGFDGHRGWIYYLAVAPDRQREGLGQAMMAAAESWLRSRGAPKLQLMVRSDNDAALGFYEAIGLERQSVVTLGRFLPDPSSDQPTKARSIT